MVVFVSELNFIKMIGNIIPVPINQTLINKVIKQYRSKRPLIEGLCGSSGAAIR